MQAKGGRARGRTRRGKPCTGTCFCTISIHDSTISIATFLISYIYIAAASDSNRLSIYMIATSLGNTGMSVPSSKNAIGQGTRKQILARNYADDLVVVVHNTQEAQTECAVKTIRTLEGCKLVRHR